MKYSARSLPLLAALTLSAIQLIFPGCVLPEDPAWKNLPKAQVFLDGTRLGNTPANAVLNRIGNYHVRIELPGYKPKEFFLEEKPNSGAQSGKFIARTDILIDPRTGVIYRFDVPNVLIDDLPADAVRETTLTVKTTPWAPSKTHAIGRLERR